LGVSAAAGPISPLLAPHHRVRLRGRHRLQPEEEEELGEEVVVEALAGPEAPAAPLGGRREVRRAVAACPEDPCREAACPGAPCREGPFLEVSPPAGAASRAARRSS